MAGQTVMVLGDVMVDAYWRGNVQRISPEAPVPIVSVSQKEYRLGGAANVARNLQALGATAMVFSVVGNDENGSVCLDLFAKAGLDGAGMQQSDERITTVKSRILGNHHQMLRVDEESIKPLSEKEEASIVQAVTKQLEGGGIGAVIFEDYDKGILTPTLISAVIAKCRALKIPVAVDPKKDQFMSYRSVSLFKPNLRELSEGIGQPLSGKDIPGLKKAMESFRESQSHEIVMVTLAEYGMAVSSPNGFEHIPAVVRDISDVSGAGDTVISVATLALISGLNPVSAGALANLAGGLVCESPGVVTVQVERLKAEAGRYFGVGRR